MENHRLEINILEHFIYIYIYNIYVYNICKENGGSDIPNETQVLVWDPSFQMKQVLVWDPSKVSVLVGQWRCCSLR